MTSTLGGVIQSLSASQAEEFDPEQVGGCPRRWYYHRVQRLPLPERENSKVDGDAGHALFAMHYRGEALPKRARMLKAVRGAIAKGGLPPPAPGQLIESRFDGQPTAARLPLRAETTLWLGAMPWDGYVDLRFRRGDTITVLDHKFSSDIHTYAKSDLLATVQMPVYALDSLRIWPDAQHVELVHNYVSRRGVDSLYVRQLVTAEQIRQRGEKIAKLAREMWKTSLVEDADDVPANKKSCHTWSGCPFQSRCSAFKEKPRMNLSNEELSWLNVVGGGETTAGKAPAPFDAVRAAVPPLSDTEKAEIEERTGVPADALPLTELPADLHGLTPAQAAVDPGDDDPFAVFAPVASVPQEQPAAIETTKPADGAKCPDCPHPAHVGAACTGKRGRGACRCGAQGPVEKSQDAAEPTVGPVPNPAYIEAADRRLAVAHLPTCVRNDAGKWLCMEGCTAGKPVDLSTTEDAKSDGFNLAHDFARAAEMLNREREMHRRTLGELERMQAIEARREVGTDAAPPTGWIGTLQVNVNLGPETLALLQRLLGGR